MARIQVIVNLFAIGLYPLWLVYWNHRHHKTTMKRNKAEHLKEHILKPLGDKPLDASPISVRLPTDMAVYVRSQPNRNQWLITAIADRIAKEVAPNN